MHLIIRSTLLTLVLFGAWQAQSKDADVLPAKTSEARSTVVIDSRPEHAEIRLNGKFVGTTPLSFNLTPGEHSIELARVGYGTWLRDLTVSPGAPAKVVAILQPTRSATEPCGEH